MLYFDTPTYFDWLPIELHDLILKFSRKSIDNNRRALNNQFNSYIKEFFVMHLKSDQIYDKFILKHNFSHNRNFKRICYFDHTNVLGFMTNHTVWDFMKIKYLFENDSKWKCERYREDFYSYYDFINYHYFDKNNNEFRWIDNFVKNHPINLNRRDRDLIFGNYNENYRKKNIKKMYIKYFGKEPKKYSKSKDLIKEIFSYSENE